MIIIITIIRIFTNAHSSHVRLNTAIARMNSITSISLCALCTCANKAIITVMIFGSLQSFHYTYIYIYLHHYYHAIMQRARFAPNLSFAPWHSAKVSLSTILHFATFLHLCAARASHFPSLSRRATLRVAHIRRNFLGAHLWIYRLFFSYYFAYMFVWNIGKVYFAFMVGFRRGKRYCFLRVYRKSLFFIS